jgi:hypothetical protein
MSARWDGDKWHVTPEWWRPITCSLGMHRWWLVYFGEDRRCLYCDRYEMDWKRR